MSMIRNFIENQVRQSVFDILEDISMDEIQPDTEIPDNPERPIKFEPLETDVLNVVNAIFRKPAL